MRRLCVVIICVLFVVYFAYGNENDDAKAAEHLQECWNYFERAHYAKMLKECDQVIALTHNKTIHARAYMVKSIAHGQLESYEQSIQDATPQLPL